MNDLISIVIPTYRRPEMLLEALESALVQDYRPLEVLVTDDSPDDASERAVRAVSVPDGIEVVYKRNDPSLRQARNVNSGFAAVRGTRIVLLHDDDRLLPGAVSVLAAAYDAHPGVIAAYGRHRLLTAEGVDRGDAVVEHVSKMYCRSDEFAGPQADPYAMALRAQFPMNGYLVDADAARSVGYTVEEVVGSACDFDFGVRLGAIAKPGGFVFVPQDVSAYRLSPGSVSRAQGATSASTLMIPRLEAIVSSSGVSDAARRAAEDRLRWYAPFAVREFALAGRPGSAMRVWCGRYYGWGNRLRPRGWFHVVLSTAPWLISPLLRVIDRTRPKRRALRARVLRAIGRDPARPMSVEQVTEAS
ncbi:MAG: glycosyltransferase family 2 protein [Planctomycetota bacterium]